MRLLPRVLLATLLCISSASAFVRQCTLTGASGSFYDLSPLASCTAGFEDSSGDFIINICSTTAQLGVCDGSTSICQLDTNDDVGNIGNYSFAEYSSGSDKGIIGQFGSGSPTGCGGNTPRSTTIHFICDKSAPATPSYQYIKEDPQCHYQFSVRTPYACPVQQGPQIQICPTYVYLVPHTHDDVGWLQTVDGYYSSQVKNILDTTVAAMAANPNRRFIYVEQAYFWRWWTDPNTSDAQRATFKTIYNRGQWEFVIGGWCMQDEACTTYSADIEQMTLGHQFILNEFGAKPTKGWQIDPFGASSVTPTLNRLSGFDGHVIDRITNKGQYQLAQSMQFLWEGSPSLGGYSEIFTEILDSGYCDWIGAFDFSNDPVTPDNVATYAKTFYDNVQSRLPHFRTNHILAEWGCDFAFQNATAMFHSMDILVAYLQSQQSVTGVYVNYTLLSDYFTAVRASGVAQNIPWPKNYGNDFFPLDEDLYWTGYFTSRTQLKGIVRQGEAWQRAAEQIFTASRLINSSINTQTFLNGLALLRQFNAEAQHHDGVSGTSEPDVVLSFGDNVMAGIEAAGAGAAGALSAIISKGSSEQLLNPNYTEVLSLTAGQTAAVVIYNSLSWARTDYVVIPVNTQSVTVTDGSQNAIKAQVNPATSSGALGKFNLFFQVQIPPLGFYTYYITASSSEHTEIARIETVEFGAAPPTIQNPFVTVTFSADTGRISNIYNSVSNVSVDVDQDIMRYTSLHSGAYAFGPVAAAVPLSTQAPQTTVVTGSLVTEVYQIFAVDGSSTSYAKQNVRLYQASEPEAADFVELSFEIGVLPTHTEVVASFSTSINNGQTFYTDDNGFEYLAREYLFSNGALIEGNYYPLIYSSYIQDQYAQLTVIAERSHGCSSLANGQFEVMIHRNPDMGDGFGPSLTDTTVVYPVLRVVVDSPQVSKSLGRQLPYLLNFPPVPFFGTAKSGTQWSSSYLTTLQFISAPVPLNVHMLSMNALNPTTTDTIIRLTHLFAVGEDPVYSQSATVDLAAALKPLQIKTITETTLTANNAISNNATTTITLEPKQIRTFVVTF